MILPCIQGRFDANASGAHILVQDNCGLEAKTDYKNSHARIRVTGEVERLTMSINGDIIASPEPFMAEFGAFGAVAADSFAAVSKAGTTTTYASLLVNGVSTPVELSAYTGNGSVY